MTRISAIVPTYNRPRELRACLAGFAAQTAPRESFEVIVIDDGSPENMEPLVMEFAAAINVVFRRIPNAGQAVAKNLAMDAASARSAGDRFEAATLFAKLSTVVLDRATPPDDADEIS